MTSQTELLTAVGKLKRIIFSNQGLAFLLGLFLPVLLAESMLVPAPAMAPSTTVELSAVELSSGATSTKPTSLRIPALGLETNFAEPLGLSEVGEVAVPKRYDEVGWYKYSPLPGNLGPAIILGHVDSYTGPAVFFELNKLRPGDYLYIERSDGVTVKFVVTSLAEYKQSDFPLTAVYGDVPFAGLRLITCTGWYQTNQARYTHNLVVYAALVSE